MVREYLVKSYIFPEISGNTAMPISYTSFPIVGEILRIDTLQNATGSLLLMESGTNTKLFNATLTSGTASVYNVQPQAYAMGVTGVTGSPLVAVNIVTNKVLGIAVSGVASGTAVKVGPWEVFYR